MQILLRRAKSPHGRGDRTGKESYPEKWKVALQQVREAEGHLKSDLAKTEKNRLRIRSHEGGLADRKIRLSWLFLFRGSCPGIPLDMEVRRWV